MTVGLAWPGRGLMCKCNVLRADPSLEREELRGSAEGVLGSVWALERAQSKLFIMLLFSRIATSTRTSASLI